MTGDALERLRAADPLAGQGPPDPSDADAVAMRERIMAPGRHAVDLGRGRSRRRRAVVAGVALAAAVATAAAVLVATRRPTQVSSVGCYAEAATDADTTVLSATGDNPVDLCRQLWESGDMDPDVTSPVEVPPLVACVGESGAVGVFPTTSCDEVATVGDGTSGPATPGTTPQASPSVPAADADASEQPVLPDHRTSDETVRRALEQIRLEMVGRCLTLQAATGLAEDVLADHGIEGWTIGPIFEGHTDQTCAGFFPAASEQSIWWTPEEPADGQTPGPR